MFYVLMSLCKMFLACSTIKARVIYAMYVKIVSVSNFEPEMSFLEIKLLNAP